MSLEKQHLTGWSSPRLKLQMFFCKAGEMQEILRCEPNLMCNVAICICNFYQVLIYGLQVSADELPARYVCCVLLV